MALPSAVLSPSSSSPVSLENQIEVSVFHYSHVHNAERLHVLQLATFICPQIPDVFVRLLSNGRDFMRNGIPGLDDSGWQNGGFHNFNSRALSPHNFLARFCYDGDRRTNPDNWPRVVFIEQAWCAQSNGGFRVWRGWRHGVVWCHAILLHQYRESVPLPPIRGIRVLAISASSRNRIPAEDSDRCIWV